MSGLRTAVAAAVLLAGNGARAEEPGAGAPELRAGALQLGLCGSYVSSGSAGRSSSVAAHLEWMRGAGRGLVGIGGEIGHRHVGNRGDLDLIHATALLSWQAALGGTGNHPFLAVLGGLQHELVGSFSQTRRTAGAAAGLLALLSPSAAVRVELRASRVFIAAGEDYNEHELLAGLALLLGNRP